MTNKLAELIAELRQLEPGQELRKHESVVADAMAESLRAVGDSHFLASWCRLHGVIVVMGRASDYMIFLKKAA
jgi:hypothetical protein